MAEADICTEAGTVKAEVRLLVRVTDNPLAGAAFESVTVHVVLDEAGIVVLAQVNPLTEIPVVTAMARVLVTPFNVADMVEL